MSSDWNILRRINISLCDRQGYSQSMKLVCDRQGYSQSINISLCDDRVIHKVWNLYEALKHFKYINMILETILKRFDFLWIQFKTGKGFQERFLVQWRPYYCGILREHFISLMYNWSCWREYSLTSRYTILVFRINGIV